MTMRRRSEARPLPKRTIEALAACEAVGLMFWSDHPRRRHVWAVDERQQAHVVQIDSDACTARHVCGSAAPSPVHCSGGDEAMPYTTTHSEGEQHPMTTAKEDRPTQCEAAQDPEASPRQQRNDPVLNISQPEPSVNGEAPGFNIFDPGASLDDDSVPEVNPPVQDIPIRKPNKLKFYRVHPKFVVDRDILVVPDGMDEVTYLCFPKLIDEFPEAIRRARLYPYIGTDSKQVCLWRINHPTRTGGKRNQKIFDTAVRAAQQAQTEWTRIWWNLETSHYTHQTSRADLGEPRWPDLEFEEILRIAFEGLVIDSLDHEVLRELRTGSRDDQ
jgi:ferredoxin